MHDPQLEVLLRDYHERCTDLRRQFSYYPKLAAIFIVVIATSISWVFAEGAFERLWLFPVMVLVCQLLVVMGLFVYKLHCIMRKYTIELENSIESRMPDELRVHKSGQQRVLAVGFYYWKNLCYSQSPLFRRIAIFLVFIAIISGAVFFYMGIGDDVFQFWGAKAAIISFAILLLVISALMYWDIRQYSVSNLTRQDAGEIFNKQQLTAALTADYEQRNEDFRHLADFYPQFLIGELVVISASLGVYYSNPDNQWVFFFAPIGLLLIPIFVIYLSAQVKIVKKYTIQLEKMMESLLVDDSHVPAAHGNYHLGFFRFEREKHVAETAGGKVSFAIWAIKLLIFCGLCSFSAYWGWLAHIWLTNVGFGWVSFFHAFLLFVLVVANIASYLQVQRDL